MAKRSGPMAQKIRIKSPKRTPEENMAYLKSLNLWNIIEKEIEELVENQDLKLTTLQDIVVASLVEVLDKNKHKFIEVRIGTKDS